jgi:undecaprenyl-diphosphatase
VPLLLWMAGSGDAVPFAQVLLLALAQERALYFCLKNTLKRRRPQNAIPGFHALIAPSDEFSFPWGHTSAAFLRATTVFLVCGKLRASPASSATSPSARGSSATAASN